MLYEIATLCFHRVLAAKALDGADCYTLDAEGTLLGSWTIDIGIIGCLLILRGFKTVDDLSIKRQSALFNAHSFGAGDVISNLEMGQLCAVPIPAANHT